jgi:hypothetical protein
MKIELRKFAWYPRLSEETNAFNADIYIDGVRSATASNDGHGGSNEMHDIVKGSCQRLVEHCKTLPPVPCEYGEPLAMDADFFISIMVEDLIKEQAKKKQLSKLKRDLTKEIMFTYKDKTGVFSLKLKPTHTVTPELISKFRSARPNIELILNELSLEDALALLVAPPETVGGSEIVSVKS